VSAVAEALASKAAQEALNARVIANLATFRPDGTIHLVPMWFLWDGEAVLLPTFGASRKAQNVRADPRATVMIDDSRGGFDVHGVMLTGRVEIVEPPDSLELIRRIHLRYITPAGMAKESIGGHLQGDDVALRLIPERVSTWDMRGTPGAAELRRTGEFEPLEPLLRRLG
jgi:PPOX class probable F420-dependent enzyme